MSRILVGVDSSAAGRAALDWALRECIARGAPLTAVRAWLSPSFGHYYPEGSELEEHPSYALTAAQAFAEEQLKLACDRVPGADLVDGRALAVMGTPAHALLEAGEGASLLVVGSRGEGALSRFVLGSVSSSVLHHARCPVAVVPAARDSTGGAPRVLVGLDHSESAARALTVAIEVARAHAAVLVPIHVHGPIGFRTGAGVQVPGGLEAADRQSLLTQATAQGAGDLRVEPDVVVGHAAAVLLEMARPCDVLVVGSRGRGGFLGLLLGSTSSQCAQHATCPVVVVPDS